MRYLLLLFTVIVSLNLSAQGGRPGGGEGRERPKIGELSGKIQDSTTNKPVEFATISLFRVKDSSLVTGGVTNAKGEFKITEIPVGMYRVKISFIGYKDKFVGPVFFKPDNPSVTLEPVSISSTEGALDEIEIVAEKADLETKIDRKVFNVEKNITATGGTVNDLLNNIPSVEVDMDGNLSLRGSGNVTVLIDGKPSSMTGGARTAILSSIPASSVESIEVITNPSAKYDPDGMSGIINIVLKKNKLKGITAGVELSAGTGNVYSAAANFNYKNEKINFYTNYSFRHYRGYRNYNSTRNTTVNDTTTTLDQYREGTDLNESHMLKLGLDIFINPKNTLGFFVTGNMARREREGYMKYNEFNNKDLETSFWTRDTYDPTKSRGLDFGLNYQHKFKQPGHDLQLNFNQSIGDNVDNGFYMAQYYDSLLIPEENPERQQLVYDNRNNFFVGMLDYVNPINKKMKIEAGAKATIRNIYQDSYNEYFDYDSSFYVSADSLNNIFKYNEQIYAVYGIWSHTIKERFGYQIGIRLEQALTQPVLVNTNDTYRNDYFSWFPSLHLSYKLGEKKDHELTLSYSKRINRPHMHSLNPFPNYSDPLNVRLGNPYLLPEYIHSIELGYAYYSKYFTFTGSGYFRYMTNMIQRVLVVDSSGVNQRTWSNVDNGFNYGVEAVMIVKPFDWWRMNISFNLYQMVFQDKSNTESDLNNQGLSWSAKLMSTMTFFKKTTEVQINLNYNAPRPVAQGTVRARWNLDFAAKQWFLNRTLGVGIRISDLFNTLRFQIDVEEANQVTYTQFKWETRRFYINLSWKFGNLKQARSRGSYGGGSGGGMDDM
ncbi:MAG: TonB-dependent receptor [Crocinitomicaceae bacterium]|nr:TonB-dependent receptor [Crocinitomicaceae bacterium]